MNVFRAGVSGTIAAVALAGLAGCTGGGVSSGSSSASRPTGSAHSAAPTAGGATRPASPASVVMGRALAAMQGSGSAHITFDFSDSQSSSVYVQDSGTDGGRQVITVNGTQHSTVLLVNGVAYTRGNQAALAAIFGFRPALAASLAGRWISFHPGDTAGETTYSAVAAGITLASVAGEVRLTPPLTLTGPTRINGLSVIGVRGTPTGNLPATVKATLYVTASGRPLPVSYQIDGGGVRETVTFGQWGEALGLAAPAGAIPAASLSPTTL